VTTATMAGSALRSVPFRRLWAAGLLSDTGDWLLFIALPLVVLRLTGSAVATSFAFALESPGGAARSTVPFACC
jgi:hypothetical protein